MVPNLDIPQRERKEVKTTQPIVPKVGDWVRYWYKGEWEYRELTTPQGCGYIAARPPPEVDTVIQVVWKGGIMQPRKVVQIHK
jgi:hypothetical protein